MLATVLPAGYAVAACSPSLIVNQLVLCDALLSTLSWLGVLWVVVSGVAVCPSFGVLRPMA